MALGCQSAGEARDHTAEHEHRFVMNTSQFASSDVATVSFMSRTQFLMMFKPSLQVVCSASGRRGSVRLSSIEDGVHLCGGLLGNSRRMSVNVQRRSNAAVT